MVGAMNSATAGAFLDGFGHASGAQKSFSGQRLLNQHQSAACPTLPRQNRPIGNGGQIQSAALSEGTQMRPGTVRETVSRSF
jgi:hypothetical protein